jgi:hypothetical protein
VSKHIPWTRVAVEGAVIVGSILLAFAIEASWQASRERAADRELLTSIQTELVSNVDELRGAAERHNQTAAAGQTLLSLTGPGADPGRIVSAAAPIAQMMVPARSQLRHGALSAVVSSGQLARIVDPELRGALSAWIETVSELEGVEELTRSAWFSGAFPTVLQYVPQLELERASGFLNRPDLRSRFLEAVPSQSQFNANYAGLLADMSFENDVVQSVTLSIIAADAIEKTVIPDAEAILGLIASDLGRR